MNSINIENIPAVSAVRLSGGWVVQLSYGQASREATQEEDHLLEMMWDGENDGEGNPWVAL